MNYQYCPVCDGPLEQIPDTRFLGCPMCRKAFMLAEVGSMSPKEERAYKRVFDSKGGRATHPRLPDDAWRPASKFRASSSRLPSSTEDPIELPLSGTRLQYMYQPSSGRYAYMNLDTDMIISDEEAHIFLAMG